MELSHAKDGAKDGAVIAIGVGGAEGNENAKVQVDGCFAPSGDFGLLNGGKQLGLGILNERRKVRFSRHISSARW